VGPAARRRGCGGRGPHGHRGGRPHPDGVAARALRAGRSGLPHATPRTHPPSGTRADAATLRVVIAFGFPPVPFDAKIGGDEWVRVTSISGNILTVIRGQLGTTASIHEVGEEVAYIAPTTGER